MWKLYLLTRLGVIFPILVFIAVIAGIFSVVAGIDILCEGDVERSSKIFKRSAVVLSISVLGIIFIPTKQDMFLIYGVGTTLDYLQDNEKVLQLPDKCVDALDAWVESLTEEKNWRYSHED